MPNQRTKTTPIKSKAKLKQWFEQNGRVLHFLIKKKSCKHTIAIKNIQKHQQFRFKEFVLESLKKQHQHYIGTQDKAY
jgi:hypothetical protein